MGNCNISVILPVYNASQFLERAILSILTQTYEDFELIIVNDGSTDNSEEIILSIKDSRVIYLKNISNIGIVASLNKAMSRARGKYIARMDADDISFPERFQLQFDYLETHADVGLCSSVLKVLGTKEIIHYPETHDDITWGFLTHNAIAHPVVMFRKNIVEAFQFTYNSYFFPAEDYRLWSQFVLVCKAYNFQMPLLEYNIHPLSISQSNKDFQMDKMDEIRILYLFESLQIDVGNKIDLFKKVLVLNMYPTKEELYDIKDHFVLFIKKNNELNKFNKKNLKSYLGFYWYIACKQYEASTKTKVMVFVSVRSFGLADIYFSAKLFVHSFLKIK